MSSFRKNHRKGWISLMVLVLLALATAGGVAAGSVVKKTSPPAVAVAQTLKSASSESCVSAPGKLCWNGVNGRTACSNGTTGNMLWIANPHSDAVPQSLVVTWANGDVVTYTGWTESGGSQNWHLTIDIVGSFQSGPVNPNPVSAYMTYTGTLGNNPVLTISGCNESGGGTTGTTTTGTTQTTTTGGTTTGGTSTNITTTNVTTTNVTTTNVTTTTPSPPKHHKKPHVPKKHHKHHVPAPPVQGFTG